MKGLKFKIGDRVKLIKLVGYVVPVVEEMIGETGTVIDIYEDEQRGIVSYSVNFDGVRFWFFPEELE